MRAKNTNRASPSGIATVLALTTALSIIAGSANAQCTASSSGINFGTYDPLAGLPEDSVGSVTVSCLLSLSYTVSASTGNSGNYTQRTLSNAGYSLNYNLYTSPTFTTIWGDGSGSSATISGAINLLLLPIEHLIYGRIPGNQNPASGSYSDTLSVTVTF